MDFSLNVDIYIYSIKSTFLISNFRHVLNIVCVLLSISPASDCDLPTFRNPLLYTQPLKMELTRGFRNVGLWRWNWRFRNVGKSQSDAGEIPKRTHTKSTLMTSRPQTLLRSRWSTHVRTLLNFYGLLKALLEISNDTVMLQRKWLIENDKKWRPSTVSDNQKGVG
jgi:hypothetical protein